VSAEVIFIVIAAVVVLLAVIMMAQPIWLALAIAGGLGLVLLDGTQITMNVVGAAGYTNTARYALVIIPMFVLMGVLASKAGLAVDLFAIAQRLTRWLPGGLGVATILACGGFSAVTGSTSATVATIGHISVEQMTRRGYRANAAAAPVALGATLGVLIPPSILMVIFAILTGQSVGRLLLAGLVPGLLTMLFYMAAVVFFYKRGFFEPKTVKEKALFDSYSTALESAMPEERTLVRAAAPTGTLTTVGTDGRAGRPLTASIAVLEERITLQNWIGTGFVAILFLIIIGGMYTGIFTSTEAGAVAAAVAVIILLIRLSRKGARATFVALKDSFIDAASVSSMIFALLFGGAIFAFFLLKTGLPNAVASAVVDANLPPLLVIIVSLVMLMILGALLDEISILLIVIPLLWPVMDGMGVDGIWYGVLAMKATAIGLIAPPVGINVFVAAGISKHVSAERIYQAILPFFIVEIIVIAVLIAFPAISTFVPDLMLGT
jgi:C4-dicarboxylate transporter DctM subunit